MRIAVNAALFENEHKTGIPIAVENVLKLWAEKYPDNEYFLISRRPIYLDLEPRGNWHIISQPFKWDKRFFSKHKVTSKLFGLLYKTVLLPMLIKKCKPDIFWGTCYELPARVKGVKYVVSVYDLAMYRMKQIDTIGKRILQKVTLPLSCRRADKILTISRASAEDIHKILGARKRKIAVSYLGGLGERSSTKQPYDSSMKPELNIKGRFILFISTIEPRKNILTLIRAFEKYLDRYKENDLYLVLAGGRGWKCDNIYEAAETNRYRDRIIMPGYISSEEKQYLLENASVFAYPSLYEGFGIPVLEAFDKGLPVVTTNVSSLPEVGGDAAFYINDPADADELAAQLRHALTLSDKERAELAERTEKQLGKFSWEKNAKEIMRLFRRLADDAARGR